MKNGGVDKYLDRIAVLQLTEDVICVPYHREKKLFVRICFFFLRQSLAFLDWRVFLSSLVCFPSLLLCFFFRVILCALCEQSCAKEWYYYRFIVNPLVILCYGCCCFFFWPDTLCQRVFGIFLYLNMAGSTKFSIVQVLQDWEIVPLLWLFVNQTQKKTV